MYGNPYSFPAPSPYGYGVQNGFFSQPNAFGVSQQAANPPGAVNTPAVIQVATIKQVEQAPVQPGGKALVLVANEPVIAMRSADNMGITSTDYYRLERFDPEAQVVPAAEYVTRAEFQQFVNSLRSSGAEQHQPVKEVEK